MGKLGEFTDALMGSATTISGTYKNYITEEAKRSTQNKQIQLKKDINDKMMEIQRSSPSDEWQTKINGYFESVKSGMSDKNSFYYCKNNLQAEMFDSILSEAKVNVSNEVNQLIFKADRNHALVEYQNTLETLAQTETPENQLKLGNEAARNLFDCGYIDEDQLQQQYNNNFDKCYINTAMSFFDNTVEEAIKRGDSDQTVIDMVFKNMPELIATDSAGLPKLRDTTQLKETLTKTMKQDYRAKQQDIWDQTEKKCAQIYDSIMDQTTAEGRNTQKRQGRLYLDSVKNTGLISADQLTKWTARFALEDYLDPEGTTTKSQASSALKKMDPKDKMEFYLNAAKRGDESELGGPATIYSARQLYQDDIWNEFKEATGNPNLSWAQVEEQCPTVMTFIDEAKKKFKGTALEDVANYAENLVKAVVNTKDDKTKYQEEINSTMDVVWDMLFETNISDLDTAAIQGLKDRTARFINSKYGGVLEKSKNVNDETKKMLKKSAGIDTLQNYKEGVFGNEKTMAKALQEREANPDLVYKDQYGNVKPTYNKDVEKGLTSLENKEREEIAAYIKQNTGFNVNTKDIKGDYEEDGAYDYKATKVYTVVAKDQYGRPVDEYQYKLSSKDGEHITMQRKKKGSTEWEEVRTAKQQEEYDKPKTTATRAVQQKDVSKIPSGGFTYKDKDGKVKKLTYTDPEGEEREISQTYWKYITPTEKQRIIQQYIEYNPEAAQQWLDSLKDKKK